MLWLLYCVVCVVIKNTDGVTKPNPVEVAKCCKVGHSLSTDGNTCVDVGANATWVPRLFAPLRKKWLEDGRVPQHWTVSEGKKPECPGKVEPELIVGLSKPLSAFVLFANGSLLAYDRLIPPHLHCAESDVALICPLESTTAPEEVIKSPHVRKCCGERGSYSEDDSSCTRRRFDQKKEDILKRLKFEDQENKPVLIDGFPHCGGGKPHQFIFGGSLDDATYEKDGSLVIKNSRFPVDSYCIEMNYNGEDAFALACPQPDQPIKWDLRFTLYPVGLLISAAFLAATLAAGLATPSGHHALHWRCQTHYIACLLLGDLLLAITQLAGDNLSYACIAVAIFMHFFFLAAFFWLNTMCFNIWWTFRDFRPTSLDARAERVRLRIYSAYAWGGPLLIAGVAAILDRLPEHPNYTFLRPRFGQMRCWFYGDMEMLTYFFGPLGVLLAVNLVLFLSTARQLTCGLWKREDVKSTTERAALGRVCLKLVVVMGVTWALDVISWACGGPQYVWYVTDLANALQGLFIFLVLGRRGAAACCRRRVPPPASMDSTHVTHHASIKVPLETVC